MQRLVRNSALALVLLLLFFCLVTPKMVLASDVVKITIPSHIPPSYKDMYPPVKQFVDRINELGKGKIEATLYHSGSLYKVKDIIPALMNGSCEIVFNTSSHTTGSWPELGGLTLPFLYKSNDDLMAHWKQDGPLFKLLNDTMVSKYGVRVLGMGITGSLWLWTIDGKPVTKPADLKGLKIRTTGKVDADFVKACGASPIFLSSSEAYEALQRGTIDGLSTFPGGLLGRNLDEVLRYGVAVNCGWAYQIYVMDQTFQSWPKDVQAAVTQAALEYDEAIFKSMMDFEKSTVFPRLANHVKILEPSPADQAEFEKVGASVSPVWAESVDADFAKKFLELSKQ
ncbi:TRAP transporter substrate-binding protein [Desulfocurvus sp. DL9XJH121]